MAKQTPKQKLEEAAMLAAIGNYLSDWTGTPSEVLEVLWNDDQDAMDDHEIVIWEPFEYRDAGWIAEHIESLACEIERVAIAYQKAHAKKAKAK